MKHFYSTASAAKALGISRRSVGRIAEEHRIEGMRLGRCIFWLPKHLDAMRKYLKAAA